MSYLVIATHHGCFLTLQQLKQLKIRDVTVVIPQSQIDKYSKFDGDIFTNYQQLVKEFCPSHWQVFVSENWNPNSKFRSAHGLLTELGKTGIVTVLEAGGLLAEGRKPTEMKTFGVVEARVHPKMKKLYTMLGEPEESKAVHGGAFYVNMDDTSGLYTLIDTWKIFRPDLLYAYSFGALWCLRHQRFIYKAHTMNFWMEAIREKQEKGEWIAYPYDQYAIIAEKVKDYLPSVSYRNIIENGKKTAWLDDFIALDL